MGIANNISASFLRGFRYARSRGLNAVTIGSDINGMEVLPFPRFNRNGVLIQGKEPYDYPKYETGIRSNAGRKVSYSASGINGLVMSQTADKKWDYNYDGMAHIGLYPDYFQDLKNLGMTAEERTALFMGAEYFAQMWKKCETKKSGIR